MENTKTTYTYHFADGDQKIELSQYWKDILEDMDREEYNNDHRQIRDGRRCGLELGDLETKLIPGPFELEDEAVFHIVMEEGLSQLTEKQKEAARALLVCDGNMDEAAQVLGISRSAVRRHVRHIRKKRETDFYQGTCRDDEATGKKIRHGRMDAGIKAMDMAELVGVSRRTYSRWESGKCRIPDDMLFVIAEILGKEKSELAG